MDVEQEAPQVQVNFYGSELYDIHQGSSSVVDDETVHEDERTCFCKCKSTCKTKQKDGKGRGCPCRTASLTCSVNCKCGTRTKPCANKNLGTVRQGSIPSDSLERQRRDIQSTRQEIQDFVNNLDEKERLELLISLLNNGRGSLDFAKRLLEKVPDEPDPDEPEPSSDHQPTWCICHNCVPMPTPDENKCCRRRECITSYELFNQFCLDRHALEMSIRSRCDAFVEPLDFSASSFRKAAYLGRGNRRVIPSCAVKKIRSIYRAPDNVYMGFRSE